MSERAGGLMGRWGRRFMTGRVRDALGGKTVLTGLLIAIFLGAGTLAAASAKTSASRGPAVRSNAVLVVDTSNDTVVFERKSDLVGPIASITKLMTALVVLDAEQPLDEVIEITAADRARGKGAFSRLNVG